MLHILGADFFVEGSQRQRNCNGVLFLDEPKLLTVGMNF